VSQFTFLSKEKEHLQNEILKYSTKNPLIVNLQNFPVPTIKKLYRLLSKNPAFIEASEEEFVNAFSGKEITTGIKRLREKSKSNSF
jgi:hypothetical protein